MARGRTEPRIIDVFVDESGFDKPRLTLAGAVVLDEFSEMVNEKIASLHQEVSQLAFMKTARSFRDFETEGFHASNDLTDVRIRFVHLLAENPGAKVFIEFSDHTARPDLAHETVLTLLEVRLIETIMRKFRWASGLRITFEQNQKMNRHYEGIAKRAAERARYEGTVDVLRGAKTDPPALAIADYALYLFGRTIQQDAAAHDKRTWQAVRPMISAVRCLDEGGVRLRRGLINE